MPPAANIIYGRRSSEGGDDFSLDTQVEACRKYATAHKLGECEVISEHFTGTKHLRLRSKGVQVWRRIESGQVRNLIVYTADRLSRAPLRHALTLIDEILEHHVHLHFVDAGEITTSDSIDVVIKSWQSAQERTKIVGRMLGAKYSKAKAGKWVGSGPAPFGFTRVGRLDEAHLEHNPDEIAIIQLLIDKYLGNPPRSMNFLRDELYKRSIPSPNGRPVWFVSTIARILRNPALIGRFDYGEQAVELPELAIIDRAIWNAIQKRMQANLEKAKRNRHTDYLLAARLKCICGRSMTAVPQTRDGRHYAYYVCTSQQQHSADRICPIHRLPVERVDAAVWAWTREHITPAMLRNGIEKLQKYERARDTDPRRLAAIDAETKRLKSHIAALMNQFRESDRRSIVEERNRQINQDADRLEALAAERAGLAAAIERAEARKTSRGGLEKRLSKLRVQLDQATIAQQIQVLDVLELRVKLLERTEKSQCIKVLITSEIAPPDELTL